MHIRRVSRGFQADHSSSSYLFYAVDKPVGKAGQAVAHRYSSRAEVDSRTARYLKWGESELAYGAYKALLAEHYDVMASESYSWWTLMLAVPKTAEMKALLAPFSDARGYEDQGVDVEDFGKRLGVTVYCQFQGDGVEFASYDEGALDNLVELLTQVRAEVIKGNTSFLQAVVSFYGANEDLDEDDDGADAPGQTLRDDMTKAELQQECEARGVEYRKSWTKDQLRSALEAERPRGGTVSARKPTKPAKMSKAAREIVAQLERV
jgi:hypothetical protein